MLITIPSPESSPDENNGSIMVIRTKREMITGGRFQNTEKVRRASGKVGETPEKWAGSPIFLGDPGSWGKAKHI